MGFLAGYHTGFGMLIIGMVVAIIAVASVAWAREETDLGFVTYERFYGLFRVCTEVGGDEDCEEHKDPHDKLQATRALATSGMICFIIALCLVSVHMFLFFRDRAKMPSAWTLKFAIGFACFGAVINIIANIIYGEFYDSEYPNAHIYYAYVFLIIASILASVGSIVAYVGRPRRIESGTIVTTSDGGATVTVITTTSTNNTSYSGYQSHPPPYQYPPQPLHPSQVYSNPPAYSDPGYPPPAPYSYQPPK